MGDRYCPTHLQVHSNYLYGKLGAYYLKTDNRELHLAVPLQTSVWGLRTRQRARTITCTQTSNYSQTRSHCPLGICSYSFSSEHIDLATDFWHPNLAQSQMTKVKGHCFQELAPHCCNLWWSTNQPPSQFRLPELYSVTCPNLQLSKEGFQTVLHSGRIILKECERRFPLECKRGEGGTEMSEWGQDWIIGKSRSWGNTPEEKWHPHSPPAVSLWSPQFPENGKLWSSSRQAQDSEMQVKPSLLKQNMNLSKKILVR